MLIEYPEHDKLRAVKDQTQAAGEFVEWLRGEGYVIAQHPEDRDALYPANTPLEDLLAQWQDIDRDALEREKRAMLDILREMNA